MLAVAVSCVVGLAKALDDLDARITRNESLDYLDRLVAGGNGVVGSQALAFQAKAWIPATETYAVIVGPDFKAANEYTRDYAADFLNYLLFPRRQADDARWIVCYGCDRMAYGSRFETLFDAGDGYTFGRLR